MMKSIESFTSLIVGDVHLADRPPTSRTDSYKEDVLNKLRWIVEYSNKRNPDVLLLLGDVFHIKRQDRNSHGLVQETASILGSSKSPVRIVIGNHDIREDSIDTVGEQPLGTLALHPNIDLLTGPDPDFPLYGIPYVDPTPENIEHWLEKYRSDGGEDKYPFIATHQAIFPEKEMPIYPHVLAENWASEFRSKYTAYGHIHSRMRAGAWYTIEGTTFLNNGAISRGSLHEETVKRKLAVTWFDGSKDEPFTSIDIPYRPFKEVFLWDDINRNKNTRDRVGAFLESLGSSSFDYLTAEGIIEDARTSDLPPSAVEELKDIVEEVITA